MSSGTEHNWQSNAPTRVSLSTTAATAGFRPPNRSKWKAGLGQLADGKNTVVKISGIVASAKPDIWTPDDLAPIIEYTVEQFGKDRIMFAGDWPVCTITATFRQWVEALRVIVKDWSYADRRRLFHDNAVAFYGL